jgi:SAM-dependent methyltransferase
MENQIENQARSYWDKTWNRFLKFHGMIAPSAKLVQHLFAYVQRNGIILDLGCGEGRNSLYLSQVGYNIVGIDLSCKAARVMRNNFFEEELKGLVIAGDAAGCHLPVKALMEYWRITCLTILTAKAFNYRSMKHSGSSSQTA